MNRKLERALSQSFKSLMLLKQSPFRLFEMTIWPLTSLFAFVFLVTAFSPDPGVLTIVILGMVGWQAVHQGQMGIAFNYTDEYWSNSLAHLWISPLRLSEFVLGGIITGILKFLITATILLAAMFFTYGFVVPNWGLFVLALAALFLFGVCIGMLNVGLMFLVGENAIALIWTLADIFVVLSGVYYSIELLPGPVKLFAQGLPSTYAFDVIKSTAGHAVANWPVLMGLLGTWLFATFGFLNWAFKRAQQKGKLVRVM